jgi:hypothetical protein
MRAFLVRKSMSEFGVKAESRSARSRHPLLNNMEHLPAANHAQTIDPLGVTKEHLSYEMGFSNVEGSSAYAVIFGTLAITIKEIVRAGTLAYTFARRDGVWKIEAQAWGRTL